MSVFESVKKERQKYGTVMSQAECVNLLNSVAWIHRDERWGLSGKTFGVRAARYDGAECSIDYLMQRTEHPQHDWEGLMVDVLIAAGAESRPTWHTPVENTQTNRPWVAPIEPREPGERVILTTKLGSSLFSAVDLYQHERARGEETLRRLRDDLGAAFVRVMWRKGTGRAGDYWNNEGYYSLVRSNLQQLPVTLMRETMHWLQSFDLRIAHCVFADNLGMSMPDQERFVDGFLEAEADYRDVTEYVEVFNEPYLRGGGHGGYLPDLQHLALRLRRGLVPDVLLALGTPEAHAGTFGEALEAQVRDMAMPEVNLITVHFPRTGEGANRPPVLGPFAPRKRSSGEPRGPGSSGAETDDPQTLVDDYQAANAGGYGWYVFHAEQLIRPRGSDIWEIPRWPAIAAALKRASGEEGGGGGGGRIMPGVDNLIPGQSLLPGQRLRSPNGTHYLEFQGDGNAVIYETDVRPIWASQSSGIPPGRLTMQTDGNLVLYDAEGTPRRATGTAGNPGAMVQLQDDGLLVMYLNGQPIWASASSDLYGEDGKAVSR